MEIPWGDESKQAEGCIWLSSAIRCFSNLNKKFWGNEKLFLSVELQFHEQQDCLLRGIIKGISF